MVVTRSETTWRQLWFDHLSGQSLDDERLLPGKMFVERNDELEVDVSAGHIDMEVRSGPRMVYNVSLRAPRASEQAWDLFDKFIEINPALLDAVSRNELPVEAGSYAQAEAIGVLPPWSAFETECSCPASGTCKHIYALLYFLGEHFDQDPFELMRFFGRSREQFLASITSSTTSIEYRPQPAEEVWFGERPTLPEAPETPAQVGDLATWPTEPPQNAPFDASGLHRIGDEALERAWHLLRGANTSGLHLDFTSDLARWAAERPEAADQLAGNAGITASTLGRYVRAWQRFGEDGVLAETNPTNVIEADSDTEYRQTANGNWYRFLFVNGEWDLEDGPVDADLIRHELRSS